MTLIPSEHLTRGEYNITTVRSSSKEILYYAMYNVTYVKYSMLYEAYYDDEMFT